MLEFERKMRERALLIEDYDFYTCLVNSHNQQKQAEGEYYFERFFSFEDAERIQGLYPSLESVVQDWLRERSIEESKLAERRKKEEDERAK